MQGPLKQGSKLSCFIIWSRKKRYLCHFAT